MSLFKSGKKLSQCQMTNSFYSACVWRGQYWRRKHCVLIYVHVCITVLNTLQKALLPSFSRKQSSGSKVLHWLLKYYMSTRCLAILLMNYTKQASRLPPSSPCPDCKTLWTQPSDCGRKPNNTVWKEAVSVRAQKLQHTHSPRWMWESPAISPNSGNKPKGR